jgi:hypothetical protein
MQKAHIVSLKKISRLMCREEAVVHMFNSTTTSTTKTPPTTIKMTQ